MKKTRWFPGSQKPELPGVYERDYGDGDIFFCWFDGKRWGRATQFIERVNEFSDSAAQALPWRGLKPK